MAKFEIHTSGVNGEVIGEFEFDTKIFRGKTRPQAAEIMLPELQAAFPQARIASMSFADRDTKNYGGRVSVRTLAQGQTALADNRATTVQTVVAAKVPKLADLKIALLAENPDLTGRQAEEQAQEQIDGIMASRKAAEEEERALRVIARLEDKLLADARILALKYQEAGMLPPASLMIFLGVDNASLEDAGVAGEEGEVEDGFVVSQDALEELVAQEEGEVVDMGEPALVPHTEA